MRVFEKYAEGQIVVCPCCLDRAALMKLDKYNRPYTSCESCNSKVFFTSLKRARSLFFLEKLATPQLLDKIRCDTSDRQQIVDFFSSFFPETQKAYRPIDETPSQKLHEPIRHKGGQK